jgi:hypothetical protein
MLKVRRLATWVMLALSLGCLVWVLLAPGCDKAKGGAVKEAPQAGSVKSAAGDLGHAAGEIEKHNNAIAQEAPAEKPHTDAIGEQTGRLREIQGQLDAAQKAIKANESACAAKDSKIAELGKTVSDMKAADETGMQRRLIALVGFGLIVFSVGVGLAVFLSGKIGGPFVAVGIALAGSATLWKEVVDYAPWIMLGVAVIGGVLLLINARAVNQVTAFAEKIKPVTDAQKIKQLGDETQSWFTRVIVGGIRKKLGAI